MCVIRSLNVKFSEMKATAVLLGLIKKEEQLCLLAVTVKTYPENILLNGGSEKTRRHSKPH